jgi:hypothetical protein
MNWKVFCWQWPSLVHYPCMCRETVRISTEYNTQESRFPRRGLNPGPTAIEVGILPTYPRRSVPRTVKGSESVNVKKGIVPNSYKK